MVHLILSALLWVWNHWSFDQISRNNIARKQAAAAYQAGNYGQAAGQYTYLTRVGAAPDPALLLNLGHSCFGLRQYARARPYYEKLYQIGSPDLAAVAAVQLGVIACADRDSAAALSLFRQALLRNPENEPARYNYELIKRTWSGRLPTARPGKKAKPKTAVSRQQATSDSLKRAPAPTLVRSSLKTDKLSRFRNLNMTEAQARQMLDAMQDNDLPYSLARHRTRNGPSESGNQW